MTLLLLFHPKVGAAPTVPVISYPTPRTVFVNSHPTMTPTLDSGSAWTSIEEVAGAPDVLADLNLEVDWTTGYIAESSGLGATPIGTYVIHLRGVNGVGNGPTFVLTITVRARSSGGGSHAPRGFTSRVRRLFTRLNIDSPKFKNPDGGDGP